MFSFFRENTSDRPGTTKKKKRVIETDEEDAIDADDVPQAKRAKNSGTRLFETTKSGTVLNIAGMFIVLILKVASQMVSIDLMQLLGGIRKPSFLFPP